MNLTAPPLFHSLFRRSPPLLIAALLATAAPASVGEELLDGTVVIVNNEAVFESDLTAEIDFIRKSSSRQLIGLSESEVRAQALDYLILARVMQQAAVDAGIRIDEVTLNRGLQSIAKGNQSDLPGLRVRLESIGIDFLFYRERIRRQLAANNLRQREVLPLVQVTEREVEAEMARLAAELQAGTEYRIRHYLLPLAVGVKAVRGLRRRLLRTRPSAPLTVAGQEVRVAELEWRRADQLPALFTTELERAGLGRVSAPIRSENGYHLLVFEDIRSGATAMVEEWLLDRLDLAADAFRSEDATEKFARELLQRLRAGESFAALARLHAQDPLLRARGGRTPWTSPAQIRPELAQALEGLEVGRLAEPFKVEDRWQLVRLVDRRQRDDGDKRLRELARRQLIQRKAADETQRWQERLRSSAYIRFVDDDARAGAGALAPAPPSPLGGLSLIISRAS